MVWLVDQWLSEWCTCQSSGNLWLGWHCSDFPWYRSCGGRTDPSNEHPKTAVIWRLSPRPVMDTCLLPFSAMVHSEQGTILTPVWSQFMIKHFGIMWSCTFVTIQFRKSSFSSSKYLGNFLAAFVPFTFDQPKLPHYRIDKGTGHL